MAGALIWAVCALWCPRRLVEVQYVGSVQDHGWAASLYVCSSCLTRLHRTVARVLTDGPPRRCWLWCGEEAPAVPGAAVLAVGTVELLAAPSLPPVATTDLYACTGCIRLISAELQRLAYLRDGCPGPSPRLASQVYSPGGHLAGV
ncbi:hypothetical protein ACIO3O_34540 [Streptomyces sp. NPDC087440]|uniref:hypothetical protein n=1 Tax=Streptomyces sp. NPDC087440 TaxID=3365790 RepID=UPI003802090C